MKVVELEAAERDQLRALLDEQSPRDALASYYGLHHPIQRAAIFAAFSVQGKAEGFLVRARTGQDLFRPLVTLRASDSRVATELLEAGLPPGQAAYVTVPLPMATWLGQSLQIQERSAFQIFSLDARRFQPVVNIFVARSKSPEGLPRYEVRRGESLMAAAGLNWRSPRYAEVFVHTDPASRERGYGRSVVSGLCAELLSQGVTPLYTVEPENAASQRLAASLGFVDTGEREYVCLGARRSPTTVEGAADSDRGSAHG